MSIRGKREAVFVAARLMIEYNARCRWCRDFGCPAMGAHIQAHLDTMTLHLAQAIAEHDEELEGLES